MKMRETKLQEYKAFEKSFVKMNEIRFSFSCPSCTLCRIEDKSLNFQSIQAKNETHKNGSVGEKTIMGPPLSMFGVPFYAQILGPVKYILKSLMG